MNTQPEILSPLGEAALDLARRGFCVFPVAAGRKVPIKGSNGFKDATRDEGKLRMWWRNMPNANIGVACGPSGLVVIDIDQHDADGVASVAEFERRHGQLAPTLTGATPGNGKHLVYKAPDFVEIKNSDAGRLRLAGVDIRAVDGYVVAAPSTIGDKAYRWETSLDPASLPEQLLFAIFEVSGRNDYLAKVIAPRLRNRQMTGDELVDALMLVNSKFDVPLPAAEVNKIAASAARNYDSFSPQQDVNDKANGRRLAKALGRDMHWVWDRNCWYIWNGSRWEPDKSGQHAMALAKQALHGIWDEVQADGLSDAARKELSRFAIKSGNAKPLNDALAMFKSEPGITRNAEDFDSDPWLLGVQSGTVDLRTGSFYSGRREDLISLTAGVAYDAAATCPRFEQFMVEITGGDLALVDYEQRAIGYTLTGLTRDQCFMFAHGAGRNGKTVLMEIIAAVMGDYGEVLPVGVISETAKEFANANTPELAKLRGKRFVQVSETREGMRFNTVLLKNMTGSDRQTACAKYEHPITFDPRYKIWVRGNSQPTFNSEDFAFINRLKGLPFDQRFEPGTPQCDEMLPDKLRAELSGILNWAIAGCLAWQQRNLHVDVPAAVTETTQQWVEDQVTFDDFIAEHCTLGDELWVAPNSLFEAYTRWHKGQAGIRLTSKQLRAKLQTMGIKVDGRKMVGGRQHRAYVGIELQNCERIDVQAGTSLERIADLERDMGMGQPDASPEYTGCQEGDPGIEQP